MKNETCENCNLPNHALMSPGFQFSLESAKEKFKTRAGRRKVWCCSGECVIQALARNKYGESSHKWPVTLAEFRQIEGLPFLRRLECYEIGLQPVDSTNPQISLNENVNLFAQKSFVTHSGRPKTHSSNATKQRAYRERIAQDCG